MDLECLAAPCPVLSWGTKDKFPSVAPGWAGTVSSSPVLVVALAKETIHRPEDTWLPLVAFEELQDPKIPFKFFCPQLSQCSGHQTVNPFLNQAASAVPGGFPDELKLPQCWIRAAAAVVRAVRAAQGRAGAALCGSRRAPRSLSTRVPSSWSNGDCSPQLHTQGKSSMRRPRAALPRACSCEGTGRAAHSHRAAGGGTRG